jgi:hypothetical protein
MYLFITNAETPGAIVSTPNADIPLFPNHRAASVLIPGPFIPIFSVSKRLTPYWKGNRKVLVLYDEKDKTCYTKQKILAYYKRLSKNG